MECSFCHPAEEYKKLHLKEFKYWRVELRGNQNYLGWSLVVLKRHVEDLIDITSAEQQELFIVTKALRDVLHSLFQPDLFNYASLGNVTRHVHVQVIPRYKSQRIVNGVQFVDKNWGYNYSPWDKNFKVSDDVREEILEQIKSAV